MNRTKALLLALVVVSMPVLAGCSALTGGDDTAPGGPADGDDAYSDEEEAEIKQQTMAALDEVQTVKVRGELTQNVSGQGDSQTSRSRFNVTLDTEAQNIAIEQRVTAGQRSIAQDTYIVDKWLYIHNENLKQRYGSAWVKQDISTGYDKVWTNLSTVTVHQKLLDASNVEVTGKTTVNGTEVYVMHLDPDPEKLSDVSGANFDGSQVESLNGTFYVATDSHRLVRSQLDVKQTVTSQFGQSFNTTLDVERDFVSYNDGTTVTLPDAASDAVEVGGNRTESGGDESGTTTAPTTSNGTATTTTANGTATTTTANGTTTTTAAGNSTTTDERVVVTLLDG
ncbi:DUF6612 family protein [Haloarchaeobius sp. DFWS5]|uniref:DUF6612 family protein n=1 Tax=Haloarchaeobius sp. DFWS5 TaxID=3446114 RepID=UPI003EC0DBBD